MKPPTTSQSLIFTMVPLPHPTLPGSLFPVLFRFFRLSWAISGYERSLWHCALASHMSCFTWNLEGSRKVVVGLIFLQLACLWFNLSSSGPWGFLFQSDGSSAGPWEKYDFRKLFERYTEKIAFFKQPQEQEITFEKTISEFQKF